MNGHVFQTFNECQDTTQFQKTVEALEEYTNKVLKYASDVRPLFKTLTRPEMEEPDINVRSLALRAEMLKVIAKDLFDRQIRLSDNLSHLYSVAWGQCSDSMQTKLMSMPDFAEKHDECDTAWLLRAIREIKMCFDSNKSRVLSLCEARYRFETIRQHATEANMEFFRRFKGLMEAYKHFGGTIGDDGLIKALQNPSDVDHPGSMPRIDLEKAKDDHQSAINTLTLIKEFLKMKEEYEAKIKAIARAQTLG